MTNCFESATWLSHNTILKLLKIIQPSEEEKALNNNMFLASTNIASHSDLDDTMIPGELVETFAGFPF